MPPRGEWAGRNNQTGRQLKLFILKRRSSRTRHLLQEPPYYSNKPLILSKCLNLVLTASPLPSKKVSAVIIKPHSVTAALKTHTNNVNVYDCVLIMVCTPCICRLYLMYILLILTAANEINSDRKYNVSPPFLSLSSQECQRRLFALIPSGAGSGSTRLALRITDLMTVVGEPKRVQ